MMDSSKEKYMKIREQQKGEMEDHNLPQDVANQANSIDESRRHFTKSGLVVSGVLLTLASRPSLGGGGGGKGGGGGGFTCKSPSGFMSGNLSHHGTHQGGGGHSCDYWKTRCKKSDWVGCERSKPFCQEFGFSHNGSSSYGCKVKYDFSNSKYTKYDKVSSGSYVQYSLADILCRYHVGHKPTGTRSDCDIKKDYRGNITNTWYSADVCSNVTTYRPITENGSLDQLAQHCVAALLNCRAGLTTSYLSEKTVKSIFNECRTKGSFECTAGVHWTASQCVDYLKSMEDCTSWT
jgi:hypothetical protein